MRSATVARVHSLPRYSADLINCAGLAVPAGVRATTAKSANFTPKTKHYGKWRLNCFT